MTIIYFHLTIAMCCGIIFLFLPTGSGEILIVGKRTLAISDLAVEFSYALAKQF